MTRKPRDRCAVYVVELVNRSGSAVPIEAACTDPEARMLAMAHRSGLRRGIRIRVRRYVPESKPRGRKRRR